MRDELDRKLCEKYPKIFRDRNGSMQETCMFWGFEHGDGWYDIIDAACAKIQEHVDSKRLEHPEMSDEQFDDEHQPVAAQVKEKFGSLRFYVDNCDEYVDAVIAMAEDASGRTCEVCGGPGRTRGGGWIRTLCDDHSRKA